MRSLLALPKAHLRLPLEAAMRPATLTELAAGSRAAPAEVLTCEVRMRRLVAEVVDDAAAAGVVWIEPALDPLRHLDRFGSSDAVLEVVLDALATAGSRHGVGTGLLVSAPRTADPAQVLALAHLAARYGADGVVALGLDPAPGGHPLGAFAAAFAVARDAGLLAVPGAGADDGPADVAAALGVLGADRIVGGVRVVEDPDLVVRLADGGVCLDLAPGADGPDGAAVDRVDHPLVDLLAAGVRCSLSAVGPSGSAAGLVAELEACRLRLDLDDDRLADLARTSIEASGAPDALKACAADGVTTWLADDAADAVA